MNSMLLGIRERLKFKDASSFWYIGSPRVCFEVGIGFCFCMQIRGRAYNMIYRLFKRMVFFHVFYLRIYWIFLSDIQILLPKLLDFYAKASSDLQ